ncbi:MAG: hypothetical protein GY746_04285, partial [Gammaproteobacteria bacterium]|nr:hypothetical protein [Gammaproteobacteria bacterium]
DIIYNTGNVGIGLGTSAPTNDLDVSGSIRMRTGGYNSGYVITSNGTGVMTWTDPATISTAGDDLGNHTATENVKLSNFWLSNDGDDEGVFVNAAGNVGVGLNDPSQNLDVNGKIRMRTDAADGFIPVSDVVGVMEWTDPAELPISTATQTALDGKQPTITGAATTITSSDLTPSMAVISDGSGKVAVSAVTDTELGHVSGVTSSIQTQLDNNVSSQWTTTASDIYYNTGNVGVGISAPDAKFHVVGSIQMADGNQAAGRLLTSDANGVMTWNDPASILTATANIIADADNDTKIQVDEGGLDDDIIHFTMDGTEYFVMDSGRLEVVNTGHSVFFGNWAGAKDDLDDRHNVAVGDFALYNNTSGEFNVATGSQALYSNTGSGNVATGSKALYANTTGNNNVANGYKALNANTEGEYNMATGAEALLNNTEGDNNVANGYQALRQNTTANNNVATGYQALRYNTTGYYNVANGSQALYNNTTGDENVAVGGWALYFNTEGDSNMANGYQALYTNTTGHNNVANGGGALYSNTTGAANVATGSQALYSNTGHNNVATGYQALSHNTTANNNVATGSQALYTNLTGSGNVANGTNALRSNTTGGSNVANGNDALRSNTIGGSNVANGYKALYSNINGGDNVANGYRALYSNTHGGENVANGFNALYANTTGSENVANGTSALYNNTTGNHNVANGFLALYSNIDGGENVANGYNALYANTTGSENVANGTSALSHNTTGNHNVANGFLALQINTTGDNNTAIGYFADVKYDNLTNATAIGANAYVSQSNSLVLGSVNNLNGATADTKVGIGTSAPTTDLDVNGSIRMRTGAGLGKIAISASNGVMVWTDPAIYTDGDNLGNHTATENIKLSNKWLSNDGDNEGVSIKYNGNVGIGTNDATSVLDVDGKIRMRTDAGSGKVAISDGNGVMTWTDPATINTAGDDLGNHTATENVKLSNFWLSNDGGNEGVRIMNNGNVGIGTSHATSVFDVNGSIRMRTGAGSGKVAISDGDGVMTWTDPAIYTAGDDLGDHTATLALNLSGNNITNGGTINASSFVG